MNRKKRTRKRAKPQDKHAPHKAKTLKNAKAKVEFWAATMPAGAFYGQEAIVTIICSLIAALVSILK